MILFIDNYDSFTFNLVQELGKRTNQKIKVLKNDQVKFSDLKISEITGLILSPGPGRPDEAGNMNEILAKSIGKFPILGICLGHQAIAQVYGAKIVLSRNLMHGREDLLKVIEPNKILKNCDQYFEIARYHSLQVDENDNFPTSLAINAIGSDNSIQAICDEKNEVYGLEFHPESIMTEENNANKIFDNFVGLTEAIK